MKRTGKADFIVTSRDLGHACLMNSPLPRRIGVAAVLVITGGIALTGCTANHSTPRSTVTATVTPSSPTTAQTAPTQTPTGTAPISTPSPGTRTTICTTSQLAASIGQRDNNGDQPGAGGGMSQQRLSIILTNTSTTPCTIQGVPGLSVVGHGNGTQIGPAATLDRGTPHPTVTLQHGAAAQAYFVAVVAAAFDVSQCKPIKADGFRIYPPGSKTSLFVKDTSALGDGTACSVGTNRQITVDAFIPYP
jgi:hypothetical protein